MNVPIMGIKNSSLAEALFTKTQQRVLGLLFGNPEQSYYTNEVVRYAEAGIGAVQRELKRLESAGLITCRKVGNQKHSFSGPLLMARSVLPVILMSW